MVYGFLRFMVVLVVVLLFILILFFFFKQKTAYEVRISDWSSDVCSSDLSCRQQHSHEQIEQDGHCFPFDLGEGQGTSRLGPPNNIRPMMAGAMLMTNMLIWNKRMKAAARAASRFQPGLIAFTWSARSCQRNPWASRGTSSATNPPKLGRA